MSVTTTAPAPSRLLKLSEVRLRTSLSQSTIYRWMEADKFPRPIKLGEACSRWLEEEIDRWIDAKAGR